MQHKNINHYQGMSRLLLKKANKKKNYIRENHEVEKLLKKINDPNLHDIKLSLGKRSKYDKDLDSLHTNLNQSPKFPDLPGGSLIHVSSETNGSLYSVGGYRNLSNDMLILEDLNLLVATGNDDDNNCSSESTSSISIHNLLTTISQDELVIPTNILEVDTFHPKLKNVDLAIIVNTNENNYQSMSGTLVSTISFQDEFKKCLDESLNPFSIDEQLLFTDLQPLSPQASIMTGIIATEDAIPEYDGQTYYSITVSSSSLIDNSPEYGTTSSPITSGDSHDFRYLPSIFSFKKDTESVCLPVRDITKRKRNLFRSLINFSWRHKV